LTGIDIKDRNDKIDCCVCLKGKMARAPFPKQSNRNTDVLELIHTDVCGPMRTESLGGAKYYVKFIDDATRWCEVRFLRNKSDVFKATVEYLKLIENQLIAVYVDDILVASRNRNMISTIEKFLSCRFELKGLEDVRSCLGVEFEQRDGRVTIRQQDSRPVWHDRLQTGGYTN
jgi:hypothetical protein